MFLACDLCGESLMNDLDNAHRHVCDREKLTARIKLLEQQERESRNALSDMRDRLLRTMAEHSDEIHKSSHPHMGLLKTLWKEVELQFYDATELETFSSMWLDTHLVLCDALALFRESESLSAMDALRKLHASCKAYTDNERCDYGEREKWYQHKRTPEVIAAELASGGSPK
jgi:hypothetical protein